MSPRNAARNLEKVSSAPSQNPRQVAENILAKIQTKEQADAFLANLDQEQNDALRVNLKNASYAYVMALEDGNPIKQYLMDRYSQKDNKGKTIFPKEFTLGRKENTPGVDGLTDLMATSYVPRYLQEKYPKQIDQLLVKLRALRDRVQASGVKPTEEQQNDIGLLHDLENPSHPTFRAFEILPEKLGVPKAEIVREVYAELFAVGAQPDDQGRDRQFIAPLEKVQGYLESAVEESTTKSALDKLKELIE